MLERVAVARTPSRIPEVSLPGIPVVFREEKSLTFREFELSQHAATQITKLRRFSPAVQPPLYYYIHANLMALVSILRTYKM